MTTKERPILFNGAMVRAILDGTKTQTRRVVKPSVKGCTVGTFTSGHRQREGAVEPVNVQPDGDPWDTIPCPYGRPGDRLWVRIEGDSVPGGCLTLEVTGIRVERVQDISVDDAMSEGAVCSIHGPVRHVEGAACPGFRTGFQRLWDSLNGKKPGCSWDDSPWVWVVEFKRAA